MRGITDNIYGKGITYLIVVSVLVALCHGYGTLGYALPSDEEMINTFHSKEATFNEMVQLLQEFPSLEGIILVDLDTVTATGLKVLNVAPFSE